MANLANVILELIFVYRFHRGLAGSAWGTVIARAGMGLAFAVALLAAPAGTHGRRPRLVLMAPLLRMGSALILRTASLYGSFLVASAVLARVNAWSLAAHQIGMQLFGFLALLLDAIAIAGQVIVGRRLGACSPPAPSTGRWPRCRWRRVGRIVGVWAGFDVLMLVRLATCGARFRSGRWVMVGAG